MRRRYTLLTAAALIVAVFGLGVVLSPPRVPTVAVIGDRAEELREALGAERREEASVSPDAPTVTFALIDRWDSLRHLPDIAELCWQACHDRASGHITVVRMRFGASRKIVIFHLPSFQGDMACLAARARAELSTLHATAPDCRAEVRRLPVYRLPAGLGLI